MSEIRKYKIYLPDGNTEEIIYTPEDDKQAIVDRYLTEWNEFCNNNWISPVSANMFSAESRVKRFMDSLSNFLLMDENLSQDETYPTMSSHAMKRNAKSEVLIPMTADTASSGAATALMDAVNAAPSAFAFAKVNKRGHKPAPSDNMLERTLDYKEKLGIGSMDILTIDTDNVFSYGGRKYVTDYPAYSGVMTRDGLRYDMDKIMAAKDKDGNLYFFDQYGYLIPQNQVKEVTDCIDKSEHDQSVSEIPREEGRATA